MVLGQLDSPTQKKKDKISFNLNTHKNKDQESKSKDQKTIQVLEENESSFLYPECIAKLSNLNSKPKCNTRND